MLYKKTIIFVVLSFFSSSYCADKDFQPIEIAWSDADAQRDWEEKYAALQRQRTLSASASSSSAPTHSSASSSSSATTENFDARLKAAQKKIAADIAQSSLTSTRTIGFKFDCADAAAKEYILDSVRLNTCFDFVTYSLNSQGRLRPKEYSQLDNHHTTLKAFCKKQLEILRVSVPPMTHVFFKGEALPIQHNSLYTLHVTLDTLRLPVLLKTTESELPTQ